MSTTRHDALIQQQGLGALPPILERRPQMVGGEIGTKGLGAEAGEPGMDGQGLGGDEVHVAEAAGVEIGHPAAGLGLEHHVGVLGIAPLGVVEFAGALGGHAGLDLEAAGHAQVHHQGVAPVEGREQVFGPPVQPLDPSAGQALDEAVGQGKAQIGSSRLDPGKARPGQGELKALADGFDFWKLGHARI